jgi:hypothetical protein
VAKRLYLQSLQDRDFGSSTPAVEAADEVLYVLGLVSDKYGDRVTHTITTETDFGPRIHSSSESTPEALAERVSI